MTYHHGQARAALLEAAGALLETEPAEGLSLRQLAERAGLSRQAPYNHFADKEALLAELVRSGFERLTAALAEAASGRAPLARAARAYIGFGQSSPGLFRLMFSREKVDLAKFPEAQAAADAAFAHLSAVVAGFAPAAAVGDLSLAAWSLVHGYTLLCIERGLEDGAQADARARLFARVIRAAAPPARPNPRRSQA